ncbi:TIR domain-containing protein [Sphingomonas sp. NSE70-1]|uniref:TIR domain-containing protein n=1 Tax=Sphingomonas caseinilyticus TaxID=2908205 RepID=A0ABT0RTI3_9SPHN|nr:TIR domain-containing protein [Sphingomonas caseinilyticus]
MSGHDIFISYCREERPVARRFAECFAEEGFSVWWDAQLHSGETFDEVIERELRAAKAVVVLWSPRSVASRWVRAEATLADRDNKLVPIIIEPCNRPIIFELTHAAELAEWAGDTSEANYQTLIRDLRRMVGKTTDAQAAATAAAAPKAEPEPEPAPEPTPPAAEEKVNLVDPAELMRSLGRLSKAQESELAQPTPQEAEAAEFYKRSEEFRAQEGDKVHCLERLAGGDVESSFVVTAAGLSIGRSAPSDIIVGGIGVSRAHCLVELVADQLRVSDLNSTNGTFIDDKRVDRSALLEVGSVLRIGNVLFKHEVRARGDIQAGNDPAGYGFDAGAREIRAAR